MTPRHSLALFVGSGLVLAGCARTDPADEPAAEHDAVSAVVESGAAVANEPHSSPAEPYATRVAVFMQATPEELERARSGVPEEDFAVIADDLMYYRATAEEYLEKRGVPLVRMVGRRPLTFRVEGRTRAVDFSDEPTLDLIVLYDPERQPLAIAPAGIHLADEYFGFE